MNVDVEIYINNIVKFFRDNQNDLLNLVPKKNEEELYSKIREAACQNYEKGEEVNLTEKQIVIISEEINYKNRRLSRLHDDVKSIGEIINDLKYQELLVKKLIISTKFGAYSLN